jgi:hypothetical protein
MHLTDLDEKHFSKEKKARDKEDLVDPDDNLKKRK